MTRDSKPKQSNIIKLVKYLTKIEKKKNGKFW